MLRKVLLILLSLNFTDTSVLANVCSVEGSLEKLLDDPSKHLLRTHPEFSNAIRGFDQPQLIQSFEKFPHLIDEWARYVSAHSDPELVKVLSSSQFKVDVTLLRRTGVCPVLLLGEKLCIDALLREYTLAWEGLAKTTTPVNVYSVAEVSQIRRLGRSDVVVSNAREYAEGLVKKNISTRDVGRSRDAIYLESHLKGDADILPLKSPTFTTVEDLMKEGKDFDQALQSSRLRDYAQFFDPQTGKLILPRYERPALASESGSETLDAVRINYSKDFADHDLIAGKEIPISTLILRDYSQLMHKIPGFELWIAASLGEEKMVLRQISLLPKEIRGRVRVEFYDGKNAELWAQDSSKPFSGERKTLVHGEYVVGSRPDSKNVINALEKGGVLKSVRSPLKFEGGNIVVGDKDAFVGTKQVQSVMEQLKVTRPEALEVLRNEFGKPVIEMGYPSFTNNEFVQLGYHIDLDMAVVRNLKVPGEEVVVMHSPDKLLSVYGFSPLDSLDEYSFAVEKARILKNFETAHASKPLSPVEKSFVNALADMDFGTLHLEKKAMEYYQKLARERGYNVVEIPSISFLPPGAGGRGRNQLYEKINAYNYTNAIFSGTQAIIPRYGIPALDEAAAGVYRSLGYEVNPMKSHPAIMCLDGGIRCASETYRKSIPPKD